ncbi:MAG: GAF domain-containing protein [Candidatus Kerfeldbacteria bacterium]|nr:GAF domain-containing protein [Candidatus Kerfeldbacteria bacterium]
MVKLELSAISLLSAVAVVACLIIGAYVLIQRRKSEEGVVFGLLTLFMGFWIGSTFLVDRATSPSSALILSKIVFVGPIIMPALLLHFGLIFPWGTRLGRKRIAALYFPTLLFLFVIPSQLLVREVRLQPDITEFIYGRAYPIFALYLIGYFVTFFFRIFQTHRRTKGISKLQVRYLLLGLAISASISVITNILLPAIGIQELSAVGSDSVLVFLALTGYAIVRHRLLDIRLIVTRSLVYGVLVTLVALLFIFVLFASAQFFGATPASRNTIAFLVAILIVFGLDPFKVWLSRVTDKVFFKAKVNYQAVLRSLSEILSVELNLTVLISKLETTLQQDLKLKAAAILLRRGNDHGPEKFDALFDRLRDNPNLSVRADSPLIKFLRAHEHLSLIESLERKIEDTSEDKRQPLVASKEEFERMGAALVAPIFAQGKLIAILTLGQKLSGDSFSNDDLQLLEVLSPQIGSSIQKANLFEEVRQFSESLKVKVEQATGELRQRNVSLETLQHLTKEITRTLDFNKVVQQIADSVATELGYLGAILVFIDDDGRTTRARAITETTLTRRALRLLPKHFSEYTSDLSDPKYTNLEAEVLRTGQIKLTEKVSDIVCPPLPKILAATIQKVVGIKSLAVVPVVSEGNVIGVIEVGTKKPKEAITPQELGTMQSVADELGVVARNLKLFDQLRRTNEQLEVANEHLKELDRAKSEFVSIASHQLRTPMTGIKGYLSMMTQGDFGKMEPKHIDILQNLLSESDRMIRLINQFLNVSKIEAGKFTYQKAPVQLEDLITKEIDEVRKVAVDKGLKIITKLPKTKLPQVFADADKLQDVILNLIDNAIKYTEKGSISVGAEVSDGTIRFSVKDTGIGIRKQDAPELFNKFVRGSGIAQIQPDGSGLGLFIAKSIIDSHGGRIWAESEGEGKGSTFQFTLPLTVPTETLQPSGREAAAHVGSTKRV